MKEDEIISINEAINELLETSIFKKVAKRNDKNFAQKLAMWLVRYILVISSMNEALKINLEVVLLKLHGEKFKKILEVTEKTFNIVQEESDNIINTSGKKRTFLILMKELKKRMAERPPSLSKSPENYLRLFRN